MAKSKNNPITQNLRGKFADVLVFRQQAGTTVMCKAPRKSSKPPSARQIEIKEKFLEAVYYAKSVLKNPEIREDYAARTKPGQSAHNVAMRDFIEPPTIRGIDTALYTGQAGQRITIKAFDDFRVTGVSVFIYGAGNVLVEAGAAVLPEDSPYWQYNTLQTNNNVAGGKVMVYAKDFAGNVTLKEQLLV